MKVAIQIFGHLRTYEQCYESLKTNLLDLYDCDVFMHTWDKLDHNTQVWHNYYVQDKGQSQKEIEQIIKKCYHPKSFKIETQVVQEEGNIIANDLKISLFGIKSMIHGMVAVNQLREEYQKKHNIHYDYIVFIRPDIFLKLPFSIPSYVQYEEPDVSYLYVAGNYKKNELLNDFRFVGMSDVLFFAKPNVISSIYAHPEKIIQQIKVPQTTKYGPEYSILYVIQNMGIQCKFINFLYGSSFDIIRGNAIRHNPDDVPLSKPKKVNIFKKPLRIHIKIRKIELLILPNLTKNVMDIKIKLLFFVIRFCLGKFEK